MARHSKIDTRIHSTICRRPRAAALAGLLLAACALAPAARAGTVQCIDTESDDWTWLQPGPGPGTHGQDMRVVRWIPELAQFVAMGDAVVTTPDGDVWTPGHRFSPWTVVDYVWNPSAGATGEFLAVAEHPTRYSGAILRSTDLVNWTTAETLDWLPAGIAWNGVRYVVVGDYDGTPVGNALSSTDGTTWSRTDTNSTVYLGDVIFQNGQFVAVGAGGTVRTSSDGLTWNTPTTSPGNETLTVVHWTGSIYVAGGRFADDLYTSPDGDVWSATPLPAYGSGSADAGALAVIGSTVFVIDHRIQTHSRVYASPDFDLANWSISAALGRVTDLATNGIDQVAVGSAGTQSQGLDGWNWRFSDDPLAAEEFDLLIAQGGITLAATDAATILRSTDHGESWTQTNSATNSIAQLTDNGDPSSPLFLVSLRNGSGPITTTHQTSPDGVTWSNVTGPIGPIGGTFFIYHGANGRFFAYQNNKLYSSTDGDTWDEFFADPNPGGSLRTAHHAGLWIVYAENGRIFTSPDGSTWTERTHPATGDLHGPNAVFGDHLYLGSRDGEILRSMDGVTWELVHVNDQRIDALAADDDRIVALAAAGSEHVSSLDGLSWNLAVEAPAGNDLLSHDGTGWTNAGLFGVAYSAPGLAWTPKFGKVSHDNLRAISSMGDTVAVAGVFDLLTYVGPGSRGAANPWQRAFIDNIGGWSTMANDGTTYVAAGFRNGSSTFSPNALFTSEGDLEWTERAPRPTYFENVVHGDFGFVVANQLGEIHQSTDGATWTQRGDFPTIAFTTVGWTGERYVAIGTDGEVVTSLDGVFFQQEPQNIPQHTLWGGKALAHRQDGADALTVLVGDIGRTWVSTDHGRTWALGTNGSFTEVTAFTSVQLIGSEFVATRKGAISISTNGVDWTDHPALGSGWVTDLAIVQLPGDDPAVWMVGDDGLVQKAPLDRSCDALEPPPEPVDPLIFSDGFENGDTLAWQ